MEGEAGLLGALNREIMQQALVEGFSSHYNTTPDLDSSRHVNGSSRLDVVLLVFRVAFFFKKKRKKETPTRQADSGICRVIWSAR